MAILVICKLIPVILLTATLGRNMTFLPLLLIVLVVVLVLVPVVNLASTPLVLTWVNSGAGVFMVQVLIPLKVVVLTLAMLVAIRSRVRTVGLAEGTKGASRTFSIWT